jgi:YqaJ-like viral recombinase domain
MQMPKSPARSKPAKPPVDDVEFFHDVEQRSDTWLELRRGLMTASNFAKVMANGKDGTDSKTRQDYMEKLAGEIVTGQVAESFRSEAMERGGRMEPEARAWYERTRLCDLTQIGFVRRTVRVQSGIEIAEFVIGCSPDSQVSSRKGLEIKSVAPHLLGPIKDRGAAGFPTGHRAQIHGTMLCCDWDEMDLLLFYTGWPKPPVFTIERDEPYIGNMKTELEKFDFELKRLVERWRR